MAKRLKNAPAKAVGLSGNFIGSMSRTSMMPAASPSKSPSDSRFIAGFYQTGSLLTISNGPNYQIPRWLEIGAHQE